MRQFRCVERDGKVGDDFFLSGAPCIRGTFRYAVIDHRNLWLCRRFGRRCFSWRPFRNRFWDFKVCGDFSCPAHQQSVVGVYRPTVRAGPAKEDGACIRGHSKGDDGVEWIRATTGKRCAGAYNIHNQ